MKDLRKEIANIISITNGDDWDFDVDEGTISGNEATDKIMDLLTSQIKLKEIETLDFISKNEGWEESRDYYAEKLGLPLKYK